MTDPIERIAGLLRCETTFLILTHFRPDGDAIGSQLALTLLLKDLGKHVEAWNDDEVPAKFRFLPGSALIQKPAAAPRDFDVVISPCRLRRSNYGGRLCAAAARPARHKTRMRPLISAPRQPLQ